MSHAARTNAHTARRRRSRLGHGSALTLALTLAACAGEYSGIPGGDPSGQPAALTDPRSAGNASQIVEGEHSGADHTATAASGAGPGNLTAEQELQPVSSGYVQAGTGQLEPEDAGELSIDPPDTRDDAQLGQPTGGGLPNGSSMPVNVAGGFLVEPQLVGCAIDPGQSEGSEATGPSSPLDNAQEVLERVLCRVEFLTTWLESMPSTPGSGLFLQGLSTAQAAMAAAKERFVGTSVAQVASTGRNTAARVYSYSNLNAGTVIVGEFATSTNEDDQSPVHMDMNFAFLETATWLPLEASTAEETLSSAVPYQEALGSLGYAVYVPPVSVQPILTPGKPPTELDPVTNTLTGPTRDAAMKTLTTTEVVEVSSGDTQDVFSSPIFRVRSSLTGVKADSTLSRENLLNSGLAAPELQ